MALIRADAVAGSLSAALSSSATTMESEGLADLPAISGSDFARLTLYRRDLAGRVTAREIVHVTAHTAGATTATILRAQEGTSARTWVVTDRWDHAVTAADLDALITEAAADAAYAPKIRLSIRDYLPAGWVSGDDATAAIAAAINALPAQGGAIQFDGYRYRVTSGYTQSVSYKNVTFAGPQSTRENNGGLSGGAVIMLDSVDPASFFYHQAARGLLRSENITYACAQFVQDRAFFKFSAGGLVLQASNVNFETVEQPFVFQTGTYFQSSALRDVQFRDSGTFHSKTSALIGTLLVLDNVHHEGSVPVNTEKIVCNLQGIRHIKGTNFLLEGGIPAADWTVLKLHNAFDPTWTRVPTAEFDGLWIEWGGTQPAVSVDQVGGRVVIRRGNGFIGAASLYKLSASASVTITDTSFTADSTPIRDLFSIADSSCHVILDRCSIRNPGSAGLSDDALTFINCANTRDGASEMFGSTVFSTDQSVPAFRWGGGYPDGESAIFNAYEGSAYRFSTDAAHGRKIVLSPSGTNVLSYFCRIPTRDTINQGSQHWWALLLRLPAVWTGGTIVVRPTNSLTSVGDHVGFDDTQAGQLKTLTFPVRQRDPNITLVGVNIATGTAPTSLGELEIYSLSCYVGNSAPRIEYPAYPRNIVTHNTAAPSTGTWKQGDVVWNTAPAAGGVPGWVCVADGTPGTWKAMANLAA